MKNQLVPANIGVVYADVFGKMTRFGRNIPLRYFDESEMVLNSTHGWPRVVQIWGHKLAGMLDLEWAPVSSSS